MEIFSIVLQDTEEEFYHEQSQLLEMTVKELLTIVLKKVREMTRVQNSVDELNQFPKANCLKSMDDFIMICRTIMKVNLQSPSNYSDWGNYVKTIVNNLD